MSLKRLVVAAVLVSAASACTHTTTVATHDGVAKPPPVSYCAIVGQLLRPGSTHDGQRCMSLDWHSTSTPTAGADHLQISWTANCVETHIQIHQSYGQVRNSNDPRPATIAVNALEPDPVPDIICPTVVGHETVVLYLPLSGRLIHAPVTSD